MKLLEEKGVVAYLNKRNVVKSYLKSKKYMEEGYYELLIDARENQKS